jgi:hypothetical protein
MLGNIESKLSLDVNPATPRLGSGVLEGNIGEALVVELSFEKRKIQGLKNEDLRDWGIEQKSVDFGSGCLVVEARVIE